MRHFFWLNGVLLRTLHHWAGVPFNLDAMMRSMIVQASLSIFWSVLALCTMLTATRLRMRPLWLTGAGLMAVVVIKLFFVDLSNVGGIERIVSFIGVGVLMLVIGYVSPVPPAAAGGGKMKTLVFLLLLSQSSLWRRATREFCLWNADSRRRPGSAL